MNVECWEYHNVRITATAGGFFWVEKKDGFAWSNVAIEDDRDAAIHAWIQAVKG